MGVRCQPERRHFECLGADPTGRCRGKWVTFDGNTPPKEGAALLGKEWGCLVHDRRMPHVQKEDRRFKRKATRFIRTNCEKKMALRRGLGGPGPQVILLPQPEDEETAAKREKDHQKSTR